VRITFAVAAIVIVVALAIIVIETYRRTLRNRTLAPGVVN